MKNYPAYQSSVLPWIKSIPSHWTWMRNGYLFANHCDKVGNEFDEYQLLSLTTTGVKKKSIDDVKGKVPESYENYQKVFPGDMVFCLFDLDCSAVFSGLSDYHGMITSAYDVAKPNEDVSNPRFLKYFFDAVFSGRYYKIYSKSVRYTINYDSFKTLKSPIPPKEEQDQIVKYLDWKVSEINRFVNENKGQIEKIEELKRNNIARLIHRGSRKHKYINTHYIGLETIPSDWQVVRNKNLFFERSDYSESGKERLLSVSKHFGVKPSDLLLENERYATLKPAESLDGYKIVHKNDLVMNIMRARNGSLGISDYDGIVSAAYCVYGLKRHCNPRFIHYLLRTPQIVNTYEAYAYGICEHRRRLYADDFLRLYSVLPSIEEQNEIVDQINILEQEFDDAILQISKEIELLLELRTKIISDAVTGQIDVRGIAIPEYEIRTDDSYDNGIDDEDTFSDDLTE